MRVSWMFMVFAVLLFSCNQDRVYHEYIDFEERYWLVNEKPEFRFTISDTVSAYNVYCNVRNSTLYPNSRLFINVTLSDTLGRPIKQSLLSEFLFEPKTGKPLGKSGLGDLYDHQIPVLKNYKFAGRGPFAVKMEQFMRTDTLSGIVSVGLAVEKVTD